jgi:hypothetical protein
MFVFYIFFVLIIINAFKIKNYAFHKEYAAIVNFLPNLKLHDIIVIYPLQNYNSNSNIITIDFSPVTQNDTYTIFKLLIGQNIPANIRIRVLPSWNLEDWYNSPNLSIKEIPDFKLRQNLLNIQNKWNLGAVKGNSMNLYNHNCKHFSRFVINYLSCDNSFKYKKITNNYFNIRKNF